MKNLLYKEFVLCVHPATYIFLAMPLMLLIPNYPRLISFAYIFFTFIYLFIGGRENKDMFYTMSLPIRKRDIVSARYVTVLSLEIATIIISIPLAFAGIYVNQSLGFTQNTAGMDINITLFGLAIILFTIFNSIFLPIFYKTGYKVLWSFVFSAIAGVLFICLVEVLFACIPSLRDLLGSVVTSANYMWQLITLAVCIVIAFVVHFFTYKLSCKRFEKVDIN